MWAAPLAAHNEKIKSPVFSPDSHTLTMTGEAHDVNLWETNVDHAVTEICATVTRPISSDNWRRYFGLREYKPTCPGRPDSGFRDATTKVPAGSTTLVASHSGKCVAIEDDGALSGAAAHQVACTDALGEKWTLHDKPPVAPGNTGDRIVNIVNAASGMCLESAETERKFGGATHIVQRKCNENGAQLWILDVMQRRAESVDVRFHGHRKRDCLNINGEATESGAYVVRWRCHEPVSHGNEIFTIRPDAIPE